MQLAGVGDRPRRLGRPGGAAGGGGGQPPPAGPSGWTATVQSSPRRMRAEIVGIPRFLRPLRVSAPLEVAAGHVPAVAHPEEQRALRSVDVFMEFAGRMNHEPARHDVNRLLRRAHLPAALETEINLGRVRMTTIGADLARLPARDRDVALADLAEDLLDWRLGIPLLLREQIEDMHRAHLKATACAATPTPRRFEGRDRPPC